MKIEDCVSVYNIFKDLSTEQIQRLSLSDRKTVVTALKAMKNKQLFDQKEVRDLDVQKIINTMKNPVSARPISYLFSLFENLIYFRSSPHQVLREVNEISTLIDEVTETKEKIVRKQKSLDEWIEMVRFQTEDARPVYEDIRLFYNALPMDLSQAKPLLAAKKQEIADLLTQAEAEKKDKSFIHILKNEILPSLTKMHDYKGETFETEVIASRRAFTNTVQFCDNHEEADKVVPKLRKEIAQLEKRQLELEETPIAFMV